MGKRGGWIGVGKRRGWKDKSVESCKCNWTKGNYDQQVYISSYVIESFVGCDGGFWILEFWDLLA